MHPHKKFAFEVGIAFLASVVSLPLGFVIQTSKSLKSLAEFFDKTFLQSFRRYLGAGDLGLFRMPSTIYGIAILVAAIGIPAAMIK
jgi:O-antigen/teichoic acid export membrane protein